MISLAIACGNHAGIVYVHTHANTPTYQHSAYQTVRWRKAETFWLIYLSDGSNYSVRAALDCGPPCDQKNNNTRDHVLEAPRAGVVAMQYRSYTWCSDTLHIKPNDLLLRPACSTTTAVSSLSCVHLCANVQWYTTEICRYHSYGVTK